MKQKIKRYFYDIAKIKTTPHSIALGFAIGTFIGILPTPGFSIILAVIILSIFKNVSKISLFAALLLFNPIVNIPFNILSFKFGDFIFKNSPIQELSIPLFSKIYYFTRRYLVGNIIISSSISILGYFCIKLVVTKIQKH